MLDLCIFVAPLPSVETIQTHNEQSYFASVTAEYDSAELMICVSRNEKADKRL